MAEQLDAHRPQLAVGSGEGDVRADQADAHPDNELVHDHRCDAAGHKLPELCQGCLAFVLALEHKGVVCPVSKEDADDVVDDIADTRRKIRAERRLEGREHDQVQERCHPAEE